MTLSKYFNKKKMNEKVYSHPMVLMVIDDHIPEFYNVFFENFLMPQMNNLKFIYCDNTDDAVEQIQNVDIVIIDPIIFGKINGFDMIKQIRKNHPFIYVICVTGYPGPYIFAYARYAGINDCILKPFDPIETTINKIKTAIDIVEYWKQNFNSSRQNDDGKE